MDNATDEALIAGKAATLTRSGMAEDEHGQQITKTQWSRLTIFPTWDAA